MVRLQHLAHIMLPAMVITAFFPLVSALSVQDVATAVQDVATAVLSPENLQKYRMELMGLAAAVLYMIVMWRGTAHIKQLARAWISVLWQPQGLLMRNFTSYPGTIEPGTRAWKDSVNIYRSFASGRRYCQYALFTMEFKARQDIFTHIWDLFQPIPDLLQIDVVLGEGCVPPTVVMIAAPKAGKALLKYQPGIKDYAKSVQVSKERANGWSDCAKQWTVMAEQPSFLYELLNTEPAIAKAFALKGFRYALISSEDTSGNEPSSDSSSSSGKEGGEDSSKDSSSGSSSKPHRPHMRFEFALPSVEKREEVEQMLAAVCLLIDLVGSYKVSPDMKKRAQELRARLEQEALKKVSQSRQGVLAQKRAERLEADRARARAAGPQALAKFEERMQRQMQKREVRKRTVKR